ncbi:hypothetical protein DEO72_LG1g3009 [Vigna unguiculata]|uniref:Uncharacterized protein n=1 Tax=Vigna unguiculata TaxID=3917 RepID=A0A4D6KRP3_VIGUN|nr:hypothetical protein DEO72_LG1g3009 [Vigna unguiculata]
MCYKCYNESNLPHHKGSYDVYLILHYIPITHHAFIPNPKQTIQEQTNIQSPHCLAQHLAQAEGSRSGETVSSKRVPFRLGEGSTGTSKQRGISLKRDPSRLGELCARSKRTLVAQATTRTESSGRASAHLAWASQARLGESISVRHCSHLQIAFTHPTEVPAKTRHS